MDRWTPFTDFFIVSFFPPLLFSFVLLFFPLAVVTCESADLVQESKKNHPWLLPVGNKNSSAKSDCFDDCPVRRYSPRGSALAQPSNLARRSSCAASSVLMTVEVLFLESDFIGDWNCRLFETGWFYSKLTDVVVRRLKKQTSASNEGSAILVLQDGCRNPAYRVRFLRRFSIDLILFSFFFS
jgi:hypothetical protein